MNSPVTTFTAHVQSVNGPAPASTPTFDHGATCRNKAAPNGCAHLQRLRRKRDPAGGNAGGQLRSQAEASHDWGDTNTAPTPGLALHKGQAVTTEQTESGGGWSH